MFKKAGWKGITAGVGLMVYALLGIVLDQAGVDTSISLTIQEGLAFFFEGLGILGIRVALD